LIVRLEAVNAMAQLIAAAGVIASLFYLAAQIRQNTRSQCSVVVDSLTQSLIHLLGPQGSDPDQMRAFVSVTEDWHGRHGSRSPPDCVHAIYHIQTFRKRVVSATARNP
jgi:hypothetical protein